MPSRRWFRGGDGLRVVLGALVAVLAFAALAGSALAKKAVKQVEIVSQSGPPVGPIPANTHYFTTIQAAVDATTRNARDWVLIEPGVYKEEVKVTAAHSDLHIRGMNRNTVILDGSGILRPNGSNGIFIERANNVWVENLTVKNFERANKEGQPDPEGGGGNEIWWTGQREGESDVHAGQGAHGWWGKYLTAYVTGLDGGYGIFAQHETEGSWNNIYASGFNDSGIYIGACWECKAHVSNATMEYNAVGYSGSNSGGELVIEKSLFKNNSAGIVPNGENPGDGPPPQDGACNGKRPGTPYRLFTSTEIARCTVLKENVVTDNNSLTAPANPSTEKAPWGVGIELPGDMGDLVENNTISDNVNNGVLGFEYPNPYPADLTCTPERAKKGECTKTIYFQFAGNKIANNQFIENGTSGKEFASQITLQGGVYPHKQYTSDNNCVSGNSYTGGGPVSYPAEIEGTWGCQNATTPPPNNGLAAIGYLVILSNESASALRHEVPGVEPPAQTTMPEPCEEVPANPLCPTNGEGY